MKKFGRNPYFLNLKYSVPAYVASTEVKVKLPCAEMIKRHAIETYGGVKV
jgi:hypothetical protein